MKKHFCIREVFEIAQDMERDGMAFYKKASAKVADRELKSLLLELAEWEMKHYELFGKIKDEIAGLTNEELVDPDDEATLYIGALVKGAIFDENKDVDLFLENCQGEQDVIKRAIQLEKDAIAYYLGLKDMVVSDAGKDQVDGIIKEEMRHVRILTERLG